MFYCRRETQGLEKCQRQCGKCKSYNVKFFMKEIDSLKIKTFGKLSDSEEDLSKVEFINREKSKLIFKKFATRRV